MTTLTYDQATGQITELIWIAPFDEDADGVDLAARWGYEDAMNERGRDSSMFVLASVEYHAYHAGYSDGLVLLQQMTGSVCQGQIDEAYWFEEISSATPTPPDIKTEFDYGWAMWTCGLISDNLTGAALAGWMAASETYEEERCIDIKFFEQCVNGVQHG